MKPVGDASIQDDQLQVVGIKRLLGEVWGLQIALWGVVGLQAQGLGLPVLREFVAFGYLTFVPGVLLLSALQPRSLERIEGVLYAVGLSIALDMFFGLVINSTLPFFGVTRPLSLTNLVAVLSVWVFCCSAVIWQRRTSARAPEFRLILRDLKGATLAPILYLIMLIVASVAGATAMNAYGNNSVLLVLIVLIGSVPLLVGLTNVIPKGVYPIAVFTVALSLLWHQSLVSSYLTGWDINIEYYFEKLVQTRGYWDPTVSGQLNSMLSITVLPTAYSLFTGLDAIWVFKVIYPVLFALVPVALYLIFRDVFDEKTAFLGAFFFMAFYVFFTEMISVLRQEIAELFFALFFLLYLKQKTRSTAATLILIIFGFGVTVSHYGLSYLFLFFLLSAYLFVRISRRTHALFPFRSRGGRSFLRTEFERVLRGDRKSETELVTSRNIGLGFTTLVFVFTFAWYLYTSTSSPLLSVVSVGGHIYSSLSELLNPQTRDPNVLLAVGLGTTQVRSIPRELYLAIQYLTEFCILVGLLNYLRSGKHRAHLWYSGFALTSAALLALSVLIPYFAGALNATRIYHIALFFLGPFCVTGARSVAERTLNVVRNRNPSSPKSVKDATVAIVLLLLSYFLFTSGFVFQVTGDPPTSMPLNATMDYPRFNSMELAGARWTATSIPAYSGLYADSYGAYLLYGSIFPRVQVLWGSTNQLPGGASAFLRCWNVNQGLIPSSPERPRVYAPTAASAIYLSVLQHDNKIYDNSCVEIYA